MGKKILFLIKNERNQRYGIISLAAVLKEKEHVLDYVFINREDELPLVLNKIKNFQPAYLAISAMSGEVMFYLSILKSIKEVYPNQYVVMGGPHPTFDKSIIKNPYIDAICSGEGEEAFVEFLDKHPDGDYISVKNFSFKEKNGRIITNPLRPLIDINTLPIPDYDFFPLQSTDKIISFSSRNCVYRCTYCFNRDYSNKYKEIGVKQIYSVMDVDKYLNTLKYLKNKYEGKFKYFHFLDDVFPIKKDWL
ncbi:MAG: cobalamin-dependent protein, partial [SAR202 cluster bacterium]|nr:cobalamin-dependent protein [SAR202 cluster bacterium]